MTDFDQLTHDALRLLSDGRERTTSEIAERLQASPIAVGHALGPFVKAKLVTRDCLAHITAHPPTYKRGPREWPAAMDEYRRQKWGKQSLGQY